MDLTTQMPPHSILYKVGPIPLGKHSSVADTHSPYGAAATAGAQRNSCHNQLVVRKLAIPRVSTAHDGGNNC